LFVTLFLVFGSGYNTSGLFFPQLLKHFGWSHFRTALLTSMLAASAGVGGLVIGPLLDRIEARIVMIVSVALCAGAFLLASIAESFPAMFIAYLILGVGVAGATLLPAAMVIANWFGERRGLAMALTFSGTSLGGVVMIQVGSYAIEYLGGWRAAYVTLAAPMVLIVIPLILWQIRTRPPEARMQDFRASSDALPGLELGEAIVTRSFWVICTINFLYGCEAAGANLHLINHITNIGYSRLAAGWVMSGVLFAASLGKLGMGFFSDRVSARVALALNFIVAAAGLCLVFGAAKLGVLILFIIFFGGSVGAPLVLIPLLAVDAMGLKRFGSIGAVSGIFQTAGAFVGPLLAGGIADRYGSYSVAFEAFIVMCVAGAIATMACLTLEAEQARLAPVQAATA